MVPHLFCLDPVLGPSSQPVYLCIAFVMLNFSVSLFSLPF